MVSLKIILSFVNRFRNYGSFKFLFENVLESLKRRKTLNSENIEDFRKVQQQIYFKIVPVSLKPFSSNN